MWGQFLCEASSCVRPVIRVRRRATWCVTILNHARNHVRWRRRVWITMWKTLFHSTKFFCSNWNRVLEHDFLNEIMELTQFVPMFQVFGKYVRIGRKQGVYAASFLNQNFLRPTKKPHRNHTHYLIPWNIGTNAGWVPFPPYYYYYKNIFFFLLFKHLHTRHAYRIIPVDLVFWRIVQVSDLEHLEQMEQTLLHRKATASWPSLYLN